MKLRAQARLAADLTLMVDSDSAVSRAPVRSCNHQTSAADAGFAGVGRSRGDRDEMPIAVIMAPRSRAGLQPAMGPVGLEPTTNGL